MKKLKYGLIILFWILVLGILFNGYYHKKVNNLDTVKELDINSELVQDLYETIVPNNNSYILSQLYGNAELTNEYKLNVAIMNYVKKNPTNDSSVDNVANYISADDVLNSAKEVFGDDVSLTNQRITKYINGYCGYDYNEEKNRYEPFEGCGGITNKYFYRKLLNAKEQGNQIILQEQSFYVYENLGTDEIYIYDNYDQDKMLDFVQSKDTAISGVNENDYIDKGSIYEYIFQKENDRYIFKEIKKVE